MSTKKLSAILLLLIFSSSLRAVDITLPDLRMEKRFGFGFSAAGPLSMLGMEFDMNVSETLSIGGGVGTGLDYSTIMLKARYFMLGRSVSPYLGFGIARWWTDEPASQNLSPGVITEEFLEAGYDLTDGFEIFLFYPAIGVQFMHPMGLAVSAELQYLFKIPTFANGTYAGLAVHWYF